MVSRILTAALLLAALPAWGAQPSQLCLSCHPSHYTERGGCTLCHQGNPASERKNIAHSGVRAGKYVRYTLGDESERREGEHLMDQLACRRCHVSGGRGNLLAVSLDGAALRKTAGELVLSIRRPVATMPNFKLNEEQITTLVNGVFAGSQGRQADVAAPVRVHFNNSGNKSADIFSTKCGGCHRMLSERLGAVGTGETAPNLSGLFSDFYPKTFRGGKVWTVRNLNKWLKNPRKIKQWARMQPVALKEKEMENLETIFSISPPSKCDPVRAMQ